MRKRNTNKTRISVTLPPAVVREIDRIEENRSAFVLEASLRELARRRRAGLVESLNSPHSESADIAEEGIEEWYAAASSADVEGLLVMDGGRAVRWRSGEGWTGEEE